MSLIRQSSRNKPPQESPDNEESEKESAQHKFDGAPKEVIDKTAGSLIDVVESLMTGFRRLEVIGNVGWETGIESHSQRRFNDMQVSG
ncbi:MAG TPA: hypothetical protein VFE08_00405 [Candidatus Sulfotelmatobacter sp.]|nr:hypothetical protein [Candidatus Sulfotelmatobacter sp.]